MTMCKHALFCGKRMSEGNRENGCSSVDEKRCDPTMTLQGDTKTAPAAPDVQRPMWLRTFDGDGAR